VPSATYLASPVSDKSQRFSRDSYSNGTNLPLDPLQEEQNTVESGKPAVIQKTPQFPGWALQPQFSSRSLLMTPFLSTRNHHPIPCSVCPFHFFAYLLSQLPLGLCNLTFLSVPFGSCSHFQIIASLCVSLNIKHSKRKHPIVSSQLQSPFLSKPFLSDGLVRPLASL
jgi:hypothetical protein